MTAREGALQLVFIERIRQLRLFGDKSISGALPLDTKLRILVEEVGEVAQAIDKVADPGGADHLIEELVQVTACGLGFLESLLVPKRVKNVETGEVHEEPPRHLEDARIEIRSREVECDPDRVLKATRDAVAKAFGREEP